MSSVFLRMLSFLSFLCNVVSLYFAKQCTNGLLIKGRLVGFSVQSGSLVKRKICFGAVIGFICTPLVLRRSCASTLLSSTYGALLC